MSTPRSAPTKMIGDRTFAFGTIPAIDAIDIEVSVARLFGEPLLHFIAGGGGTPEEQLGAAATAVRALAMHPDHKALKAELKDLIEQVLKTVACVGAGSPSLEVAFFNGRNRQLWEVLIEALKVNFADFFPAKPSDSPPAATTA